MLRPAESQRHPQRDQRQDTQRQSLRSRARRLRDELPSRQRRRKADREIAQPDGRLSGLQGTPTASLLGEIQFADASIGEWSRRSEAHGLLDNTLIIITAKHGQSPSIRRATWVETGNPITTSPAEIATLAGCCPSPNRRPTHRHRSDRGRYLADLAEQHVHYGRSAVSMLETNLRPPITSRASARFSRDRLTQLFNAPGLPPNGDPRTPDILVTPNIGVTYSGSTKSLPSTAASRMTTPTS